MSDLESQIRELTLRVPSAAMDQRILSVLQTPATWGEIKCDLLMASDAAGAAVRKPEPMPGGRLTGIELSNSAEPVELRRGLRRGIAATVVWMIAAASLLIGITIGRALPTSTGNADSPVGAVDETSPEANRTNGNHRVSNPQESASAALEADAAQAAFSESFAVSTGETQPGSGDASQIAESVSLSPRDAAVHWEQQTGQIFNVATHVHDRRFNMCRECHRIGG